MSTPQAREIDCADAVAAAIAANWSTWTTPGPTAPSAVTRLWVADINVGNVDDSATLVQGCQVYVVPSGMSGLKWITRGTKRLEYEINVTLVERYTGAGTPPNSWVDPIVLFGEQVILDSLSNPNLVLTGPAGIVTNAVPDPEDMPTIDTFLDWGYFLKAKTVLIRWTFKYYDQTNFSGGTA